MMTLTTEARLLNCHYNLTHICVLTGAFGYSQGPLTRKAAKLPSKD